MNSSKVCKTNRLHNEIGGYIELEFNSQSKPFHNAIAINCARNGLKYIIKAFDIKKINVPYYTCPVVWEAIEETGCEIQYYKINKDLMPECEFDNENYILYTNYFGICSNNIKKLSKKYKNLIVDNAQAFYMKPMGIGSIYSPRKFFGAPDGGYVYCKKIPNETYEKDCSSHTRISHLVKRIEGGANFGYDDFNKNEDSLRKTEIKYMSDLTAYILSHINYKEAKEKRLRNFNYLHKILKKYNKLKIALTDDIPMYYPLYIENNKLREELVRNNIYIPKCWRGGEYKQYNSILQNCLLEQDLSNYIFPLIIDQRYNISDMQKIIKIIKDVI